MHNCGNPWHDIPIYLLLLISGGGIAAYWYCINWMYKVKFNHIHAIRQHGVSLRHLFIPESIRYKAAIKKARLRSYPPGDKG